MTLDAPGPPRVSVVIPTYNAAPWIEAAVTSALAQTLQSVEVLVFDNASTDDTAARMSAVADPRFTYRRYEQNVGFAGNVTRGIQAARGQYLLILGADDMLEPDFLARAVSRLDAAPEASMLHGGAWWVDDDGVVYGRFTGEWADASTSADAFVRCFTEGFCFSTVLCRTEAVKRLGGMDESWGAIADTWLFLRLCCAGDVLFLREPLVRYRVREDSLSFDLYGTGRMFRDQIAGVRTAFAWPEARAIRVSQRAREAAVGVARDALATLHLTRLGRGSRAAIGLFVEVGGAAPGVLLLPSSWARLGLALLPAALIRALRERRRHARRAVAGQAANAPP